MLGYSVACHHNVPGPELQLFCRACGKSTLGSDPMITVSVLYPNNTNIKFDMNYYLAKHIPMVQQKLGSARKNVTVEECIAGAAPGAAATYVALAHLAFDSVDAFQAAFGPHAAAIMSDIPNYTNAQPVVQISEVKM
jgi:uncharacterized protein (TIGR02118 family)